MDRPLIEVGELPCAEDFLGLAKETLFAIGYMAQAAIGPNTGVSGLPIAPTGPPSLSVTIGVGSIYSPETADTSAYGVLGTDASQIVKQGILNTPATLTITPPSTSGYSQYYLVQCAYSDVDGGSVLAPFYNSANPSAPSSSTINTIRQGQLVVELKAGTAAPTGSQTVPAPDAGFSPLYVILVANGATTITSANWYTHPSAPFFPDLESLTTSFLPIIPQTTFWVDPVNGSDSNPGTEVLPFKTPQACVNYASGFASASAVTINVLTGTTTVAAHNIGIAIGASQIAAWNIVGSGVGTSIIDASATGCIGVEVTGAATVSITGFTIKAYYYGVVSVFGNVTAGAINCVLSSTGVSIAFGSNGGNLLLRNTTSTITGSGQAILAAVQGGFLEVGYHDLNNSYSAAFTITTSCDVTNANVVCDDKSLIEIDATETTFSGGGPTGAKYTIARGSGINTAGHTTIMTGTLAGSTDSSSWLA